MALAGVVLAAAILWAALIRPQTGLVGDLIVVIYLLIIPPVATIVGAGASGSPHASIGASREMKLILSYELPLFLALLVGVIHAGWTLELGAMSAASALYSISGVLAMLVALVSVQAKLGQVPFDVAEAECEIMTGVFVEYSGAALALIYLARAAMLATLPLLLIAVFWGGLHGGWGILPFIGKYLLLVTLVTLIRNTNPRLRIDQAVKLFWWALTPIAILAVVLAFLGYSWNKAWL